MHRNIWLVGVLLLMGASIGLAQTNATLTGTVSDGTGAVIPAAEIVIMNIETGESYTTTTNETGSYTIPFIKPGTFELIVTTAGFKQYTREGIRLDTASAVRADAVMELGEVTESVTVEADVPLLKTENSSVGGVIQNKSIANMPLLGRRAAQLVRLSGFVVQNGTGSQFQIAGGRSNNAMWTLDGGSTQNILLGVASLNYDPPIEALEEMNVEVSNYKAEMGRSGGGFIQMTTKSGTNSFHGALYEFVRNDAMDSRHFFAGANKQVLRRNQFGWALGGPIIKDRTFFFASQEYTLQRTASPRIENIPDPAEWTGDFSGIGATVRNPVTGEPVPNNIIPASEQDPVGAAVAQFWPQPNIAGRPTRSRNYTNNARNINDNNTLSLRVDHTLGQRHRVYGRYVHTVGDREDSKGIWPLPVHTNQRIIDYHYFNWSVTEISNGGMHLTQVATIYCGCPNRDSRLVDCPQRTANEALRVRFLRLASHDRTVGGRLNGRRLLNQPVAGSGNAPASVAAPSTFGRLARWRTGYRIPADSAGNPPPPQTLHVVVT